MPFHVRLKEVRLALGYTQRKFAETIGVSLRSYQRYEQGTMEPNLAALVTLAERYNVSLDFLLGLVDDWRSLR